MRIIFLVLAIILIYGCDSGLNTDQTVKFKRPAIVMAVSKHDYKTNTAGGIVITDASGDVYTFSTRTYFGMALSNTYNKGDTIK